MLKDFIKTKRSKKDLKIALAVIREFKKNESDEEWAIHSFATWERLEELEDYLDLLTNK